MVSQRSPMHGQMVMEAYNDPVKQRFSNNTPTPLDTRIISPKINGNTKGIK